MKSANEINGMRKMNLLVIGLAICLIFAGCEQNDQSTTYNAKPAPERAVERTRDLENNRMEETYEIVFDSMSNCLNMGLTLDTTEVPFDQDCIEWIYSSNGKLHLRHANAGFNCCPEIDQQIVVFGDTIFITEVEVIGQCDCLCLFDLYYTIPYLPSGTYVVSVTEPYVGEDQEQLKFELDLAAEPEGIYCVERNFYPWGVF